MKSRDRASYNIYQAYNVTRKTTINMELEQTLVLGPGDVILELPDGGGYLMMSAEAYKAKFETISDER